jgi:ribosomal protein L37AE/L43A
MIKQPQAKLCEFCGHKVSHHVHEGIDKCAHCDCSTKVYSLSQASGNSWWKKIINWFR